MARPKKDGLLYFSFDTDFFYADNRIRTLRARFGSDGLIFYIYLLTEIYRNGYYLRWNEESEDNVVADLNLSEGLIKQILKFLINRSLLTSILVNSDTIITAPGIQKRYQEAVKSLKRDVFVDEQIWLLSKEETATCIKFAKNDNKSQKNQSKSEKNYGKSEKNSTKETKGNEMKLNNSTRAIRFNDFFQAYPKQKNMVAAEKEYMLLLFNDQSLDEQDLVKAAENYAEAVSILSIEDRYIKNPDRFLSEGRYMDYLDANYKKPDPPKKKNKFNDFTQREYDMSELEKQLLHYGMGGEQS